MQTHSFAEVASALCFLVVCCEKLIHWGLWKKKNLNFLCKNLLECVRNCSSLLCSWGVWLFDLFNGKRACCGAARFGIIQEKASIVWWGSRGSKAGTKPELWGEGQSHWSVGTALVRGAAAPSVFRPGIPWVFIMRFRVSWFLWAMSRIRWKHVHQEKEKTSLNVSLIEGLGFQDSEMKNPSVLMDWWVLSLLQNNKWNI